jgi:hypothetical protein
MGGDLIKAPLGGLIEVFGDRKLDNDLIEEAIRPSIKVWFEPLRLRGYVNGTPRTCAYRTP